MHTSRLRVLICAVFLMAAPYHYTLAYEVPTHAAITQHAVTTFMALHKNDPITSSNSALIVKGAQDEDIPPRYINHFYDPIHNLGWLGDYSGSAAPLPSKNWAFNSTAQSASIYHGDYSWPPRDGKNTYETAGHMLHLLQDITVPEHTRLDTHLPLPYLGSPYEMYFGTVPVSRYATTTTALRATTLDALFDELALYSNRYFFSEDTIETPRYTQPRIIGTRDETITQNATVRYALGMDDAHNEFRLALVLPKGTSLWRTYISKRLYTVNDPLVMDDYASRLIPRAIAGGVRALEIMLGTHNDDTSGAVKGAATSLAWDPTSFTYKDTPIPLNKKNAVKKIASTATKKQTTQHYTLGQSLLKAPAITPLPPLPLPPAPAPLSLASPTPAPTPAQQQPVLPQQTTTTQHNATQNTIINSATPSQDPPTSASPATPASTQPESELPPTPTAPAPLAPPIVVVEPQPAPQPVIIPIEQRIVINEVAWAGTAESSSNEWIELYNPTGASVSLDGWTLLSADGSPHISLQGLIGPFSYFLLERTDDSTVPSISANQIYTGGLSNSGEHLQLIDPYNRVIDEISGENGWPAGDATNKSTMQRINPTAAGTNAANWSTSPTPQGTPKAPNTGSTLGAFPSLTVALSRSTPYELSLHVTPSVATTTLYHELLYTPLGESATSTASSSPCALAEATLQTATSSIALTASSTSQSFTLTHLSPHTLYCLSARTWTDIGATAWSEPFSAFTLAPPIGVTRMTVGGEVYGGVIWTPYFNPYLVVSDLKIMPGATLVIEPGVVIKFAGGRQIIAQGTLTAVGTDNDPIVFTSYADDEFAGDSNSDKASTTPMKGDWERIQMGGSFCTSTCGQIAGPVTLNHTVIRYGGGLTSRTMLYNSGSQISIINSDIGYSLDVGIYNKVSVASSSTSTIRFNVFHDTQTAVKNDYGARVDLNDNTFYSNTHDISP